MDYEFRKFRIANPAGIGGLLDLIHDEEVEVEKVVYDSKLRVVTIPFRRIFHGGPERVVRKTLFSSKREVGVLCVVIRIKHVTAAKTIDTERIGTYTFEEVAFETSGSQLVFKACPKLELRFSVSNLEIEYEETGFAGKALITDGLFWQKSRFT